MANVIKKGGLRLKTAAVDQPLLVCLHDSADTSPIGIGDPVKTNTAGAKTLANGPFTKAVSVLSANTDAIFGVCEGVLREFVNTGMNLDSRYAPASTEMYVLIRKANVSDIFAITEDGAISVTDIGLNANLTGNTGGTTFTTCDLITGQSTILLDSSTVATTAGLQVKTIGYEDTVDNVPGTTNSSVMVVLNLIEGAGSAGV